MDYQETIEVLNNHERYIGVKYVNGIEEAYVTPYFENALNTAISAMRELEKHHNAGLTSKQVSETICELSATKRILGHYKQLGTLKEVREAVERNQAKKPLLGGNTDKLTCDIHICPYCCGIVGMDDMRADFCADCGQHIDWSEEE